MAVKKLSLVEKISAKLVNLGIHERKAKELAKGLSPSAHRMTEKVFEKLVTKLVKLGVPESKAKVMAKSLAPTIRAAIKVKSEGSRKTAEALEDEAVEEVVLRLDLPVVAVEGKAGLDLLRVMEGWTTHATYLVAAVKGDVGIVAVRKLYDQEYNVKFYPNMAYWGKTPQELSSLGGWVYLARPPYERMHFSQDGLKQLLARLEAEAKPKSRVKALIGRMKALTIKTLESAFYKLVEYRQKAA